MATAVVKKAKSVAFTAEEMKAFRKLLKAKKYKVAVAAEINVNVRSIERLLKNKWCSPDVKEKILPFLNLN